MCADVSESETDSKTNQLNYCEKNIARTKMHLIQIIALFRSASICVRCMKFSFKMYSFSLCRSVTLCVAHSIYALSGWCLCVFVGFLFVSLFRVSGCHHSASISLQQLADCYLVCIYKSRFCYLIALYKNLRSIKAILAFAHSLINNYQNTNGK